MHGWEMIINITFFPKAVKRIDQAFCIRYNGHKARSNRRHNAEAA